MSLTDQTTDVAPVPPASSPSRGRRRSIVVVIVLVLAIGALLSQGLLRNLNYFETVDQAMGQLKTLGTSDFRLEGVVAPGTIQRTSTGTTFFLEGKVPHEVLVVASGSPPELFQANIPVVVDGHFSRPTYGRYMVFRAHQILVKHSPSYVSQHPGRVRAPNGTTR
jgi:cytochrome c-type biogenesis protein CcmE